MSSPVASPLRPGPPAGRDDRFPPGIPYIVGNEGAERFSFYGMRQILYIYLTSLFIGFAAESTVAPDALAGAKVHATQVTHLFNAGVYLFPMIGAILADRLLGKYRVIFWVSLVYCAGQAALALGGHAGSARQSQPHPDGDFRRAHPHRAWFWRHQAVRVGQRGRPVHGEKRPPRHAHLPDFLFHHQLRVVLRLAAHPLALQDLRRGGRLRRAGRADGPGHRGLLVRPPQIRAHAAAPRRPAGPARFSRLLAAGLPLAGARGGGRHGGRRRSCAPR